jgi:hypothetical protein
MQPRRSRARLCIRSVAIQSFNEPSIENCSFRGEQRWSLLVKTRSEPGLATSFCVRLDGLQVGL